MANETNLDHSFHLELNLSNTTTRPVTTGLSFYDAGSNSAIYFQGCVVTIGFIGALANGFVLRVLCTKNKQKETKNVLLINQVSIDLYCCCSLVIAYGANIKTDSLVFLSGWWSSVFCKVFDSQVFLWMGLNSSIASLVAITVERYVKILHPIGHRKHFHRWMATVVMVSTWIVGFLSNAAGFGTSEIVDGRCFPFWFWPSETFQVGLSVDFCALENVSDSLAH